MELNLVFFPKIGVKTTTQSDFITQVSIYKKLGYRQASF
jgi:hypothetical protein